MSSQVKFYLQFMNFASTPTADMAPRTANKANYNYYSFLIHGGFYICKTLLEPRKAIHKFLMSAGPAGETANLEARKICWCMHQAYGMYVGMYVVCSDLVIKTGTNMDIIWN